MDNTETLYNIVVRNDKTGEDVLMTSSPLTHREACVMKSKLIPDSRRPKHCRTLLVESV
jgi:hypothetical protein